MLATPTSHEKFFPKDKILVTKTDLSGKITYANTEFIKIVGLTEKDLIGKPHSIIRHPDMPRIIFKYLWDYLKSGKEIHAYVKNLCADGSFYWVMANATPSFDLDNKIIGFHSARRNPTQEALNVIKPLYKELLSLERNGGMEASAKRLQELLDEKGVEYDEFILSI